MYSLRSLTLALPTLFLALVLSLSVASAATYVIDDENGALFDGIIDGVPFGAPNDGTPDAAGQALSVATKTGVTDLRTILEFPLSSLDDVASADVVSATLTFNVDDVIGSFGPGFGFDGTAASAIFAWAWAGNGAIDLSDFNNVVGPPSGSASPGADGTITDATLAISGPLVLEIDITVALKARLDALSTHLGITLAVNDNNTATSLDNLGNGSAGPAGVNGSIMPVLTVVVVEPAPPSYSAEEQGCQNAIAAQSQKLAATEHKLFAKCFKGLLKDIAAGDDATEATTTCAALLGSGPDSKVSKARGKAAATIESKCLDVLSPSAIGSPCDDSAATFAAVASCVVEAASDSVQSLVRDTYADGCALLTAVALDGDYPTICLVP